jgi:hypothetical protein
VQRAHASVQVYVNKFTQDECGNPATAFKLNATNTCIKLTDDTADYEYELFFKVPE